MFSTNRQLICSCSIYLNTSIALSSYSSDLRWLKKDKHITPFRIADGARRVY